VATVSTLAQETLHNTLVSGFGAYTMVPMSNCHACNDTGWDAAFGSPCDCAARTVSSIIPGQGHPGTVAHTPAQANGGGGAGRGAGVKVATVKQIAYLRRLCEAADQANPVVARAADALGRGYGITAKVASEWIDTLRSLPASAPQVAAGAPAASVRSNRYPGCCATCGAPVATGAGRIERNAAGKWITFHLDGQCPAVEAGGLDLTPLAKYTSANVARFAVPGGETRLKLRLAFKRGTVWVTDAAVYGERTTYGSQRPGQAYRGKCEDALRTILADPIAALAAYGALTSECGVCGRPLEDAESVARGIGPICNAKVAG
jgi:hypothetical protein